MSVVCKAALRRAPFTACSSSKSATHKPLPAPKRLAVLRAAEEQKGSETAASSLQTGGKYVKEWNQFGTKIIETDQSFQGPEDQKDFWEGEQFEAFGEFLSKYFYAALIVLGLIVGGTAARLYSDDADVYIQTPTGPDDTAKLIPAAALTQAAQAPNVAAGN